MSRDHNPSPPSRYDKLKRAQHRLNGDYTLDASRLVTEKIIDWNCCACIMCYLNCFSN